MSDPNRCPGCGYYGCDCECPRKLSCEEAVREIRELADQPLTPIGFEKEVAAILDRTELPAIERAEPGGESLNEASVVTPPPDDVGEASSLDPVTPVDWPDSPGVWECSNYEGKRMLVAASLGKSAMRCVPLDDLEGGYCSPGRSPSGRPYWSKFVKCTVTVPPIKEPEPTPEKPLRLLALITATCDNGDNPPGEFKGWHWIVIDPAYPSRDDWEIMGNADCWAIELIHEINADASDPEAVELWEASRES